MPSLHELQAGMMHALLRGASAEVISLIDAPRDMALARLEVHAKNIRSNFVDALRSTYPAVHRLVGDEYFRQVAAAFQLEHPSPSGDLLHAGRLFSAHLGEHHGGDRYAYLADVARLEWLVQEALLAADQAPLDLQKMAGVAASAYDTLRFELHPTLRLFESRYPALRIWEANVGDEADTQTIDLDSGGERLMVMRRDLQLHVEPLSTGEHCMLDQFRCGMAFAPALAAAAACDEQFDGSAALQRFVAAHAIVDFR
jgi:Putative DNA-binding domain